MQGTEAMPSFVERLTKTLTRTERYILALYYCEELTTNEIGLVLDMPEPRVTSLLSELRERTRAAVARFSGPQTMAG